MEFSIQILSPPPPPFDGKKIKNFGIFPPNFPPPPPLRWKKNIFFPIFFYVFIMFIITKFGENFEEKIDICFLKNV